MEPGDCIFIKLILFELLDQELVIYDIESCSKIKENGGRELSLIRSFQPYIHKLLQGSSSGVVLKESMMVRMNEAMFPEIVIHLLMDSLFSQFGNLRKIQNWGIKGSIKLGALVLETCQKFA